MLSEDSAAGRAGPYHTRSIFTSVMINKQCCVHFFTETIRSLEDLQLSEHVAVCQLTLITVFILLMHVMKHRCGRSVSGSHEVNRVQTDERCTRMFFSLESWGESPKRPNERWLPTEWKSVCMNQSRERPPSINCYSSFPARV